MAEPTLEQLLAFEDSWARSWRLVGKDVAIHEELGITPTHYAQLLNAAIDDPAALALAPLLVKRLRRLRAARRIHRRTHHLEEEA